MKLSVKEYTCVVNWRWRAVLTHRAVLAVPTFHIKLLFPRVPKRLTANPGCSEIHEKILVFSEAFLIVNLPEEYLKNHRMIQEFWQHHREFREEKELRKVWVKNHCNQYFYLAFREKLRRKVWTTEIVLSLWLTMSRVSGLCTQSGMINPSHPSSEMHPAGLVNFRTKAENPTRALQWIKEIEAAKSLDDFITQKSITGQNFLDYEELDVMMTSALKRCYDK